VCLILLKEIFRFKFIPEMFSRFQEMNDAKLYATSCHDVTARPVTKLLSEYINKMSWKTGDRVLDVGCGPGSVTTQVLMCRLPADFGLLLGADLSANMIQYASKTYEHSKVKFTQFDISKDIGNTTELWPSDFDKIFSFFCLHWIPDKRYYWAINQEFNFNILLLCVTERYIYGIRTHA
jgi:trans-aconitate methyltransferase